MAVIHVLEQTKPNTYRVVVHTSIPAATNSAGIQWSELLVRVGVAGKTKLQASAKVTSIVNVLDGNGDPIPLLDENEDPVVDGNGDPVYQTETQVDETVGAGQISDAEKASIGSGALVEVAGKIAFDGAPSAAALTALATRLVNDWKVETAARYKWYGQTRG